METVMWQCKKPEDTHWLNVPGHMVVGLKLRGYQVRELVDRVDAQKEVDAAREGAPA